MSPGATLSRSSHLAGKAFLLADHQLNSISAVKVELSGTVGGSLYSLRRARENLSGVNLLWALPSFDAITATFP